MVASTAGYSPDDEKRPRSGGHRIGQRRVGRLVREVLFAGEKPYERTTLMRNVIANRAAQHWITGFELRRARNPVSPGLRFQRHLAADSCQRAKMHRQNHADHGSVWTSTDTTAGRSRTMGFQLSPASAEAYTWPPVVPK